MGNSIHPRCPARPIVTAESCATAVLRRSGGHSARGSPCSAALQIGAAGLASGQPNCLVEECSKAVAIGIGTERFYVKASALDAKYR